MTLQTIPAIKLAPGQNNVAGLKALHELNPPLFDMYTPGPFYEWVDAAREIAGDMTWKTVGTDEVRIMLDAITYAEWAELRTTFFTSGLQADVTVQVWNPSLGATATYNAVMIKPRMGEAAFMTLGALTDVELRIVEMEVIP